MAALPPRHTPHAPFPLRFVGWSCPGSPDTHSPSSHPHHANPILTHQTHALWAFSVSRGSGLQPGLRVGRPSSELLPHHHHHHPTCPPPGHFGSVAGLSVAQLAQKRGRAPRCVGFVLRLGLVGCGLIGLLYFDNHSSPNCRSRWVLIAGTCACTNRRPHARQRCPAPHPFHTHTQGQFSGL